ncbi:MAG: hypothetical protein AB1Z98_07910, partial [Nannocystaceae bacterium]
MGILGDGLPSHARRRPSMPVSATQLFALIITLGIVVDDAIVVGEHADYRARVLGEDAATAAERAAIRM